MWKTRQKHRDPWWIRTLGPVLAEGGGPAWPARSWALLAQAREAVTWHSGAALEARVMGVPVVNHPISLAPLRGLPGAAATYHHMLEDPLDRVITWLDAAAGARVVTCAEQLC